MKNQKGVNLVSLSVAVIVIIAIAGTVLYNVRTNLGVQKLKAMQADIENLRGKVENYYLQYGALPVLNVYSGGERQDTWIPKDSSILKDVRENAANDNLDTGDYYVIDLKAMENITLTYGEDYENLKDKSAETIQTLSNGTLTDVYIINSVSHNIFYVHGVKYEGKTYYTQYQEEEENRLGDANLDIDINVKKINQKVLIKIKKGETAPNNRNAFYIDEKNHQAIIPAGFTVSNEQGESSIETGLVIRDDDGNEFVWIPVGIPWKSDPSKTIELARYEFKKADDETAETILQTKTDGSALTLSGNSTNYFTEEGTRETGTKNAVAKDINDFIAKTNAAGGFWIGRYEARTTSQTARSSKTDPLTSVTEKPEYAVYNYITQQDASAKARTMYTSDYFESDLINSYAWDTATLFLQEFGWKNYSIQTSINTSGPNANGTVSDSNKDNPCNVYDMASNWTWR